MESINDDFNDSGISSGEARRKSSLTSLNSSGSNNRSILKELNTNDCCNVLGSLTSTTAKQSAITAASNKMTTSPSPLSKDITASVLMSPSMAMPAPVASSAVVGSVALEAADSHKENPFLSLINKSADLDNSFTRFSGLPEFDECQIPELASGFMMNSELDDPLGLTFEEGLIPTLTAKMNQHLNSTTAKDDSITKTQLRQQLVVVANETDTALSSDNETFAECQTYHEDDVHQHDVINKINTDNIQDFSEADSYFSVVNSNVTITNSTIDQMAEVDATLGNVLEDMKSQLSSTEIIGVAKATNDDESKPIDVLNLAYTTFDDYEPMDVDMSFSELINIQNVAETVQQQVDSTQQHVTVAGNVQHNTTSESVGNATTATQSEEVSQLELTKHEISLNKSIELPTISGREKKLSSECVIQDNSIDSATDNLSDAAIKDTEDNMVPEINIDNETDGSAETLVNDVIDLKGPSSSLDVPSKLSNLTLDLTSSFSSAKDSAPTSPTFPIKTSLKDVKEFPRSLPTAAMQNKQISYLEKSEYAERQQSCAVKKTETTLSTVAYDSQESTVQQNGTANLNITIDLCTPEKSISPVPNGEMKLNGSFNNDVSGVESARSSVAEFQDNLSVNSRLTFGTTPITDVDAAESFEPNQKAATNNIILSNTEKRRTFNVNDGGNGSLPIITHNEKRYTVGNNLEVQSSAIDPSPSIGTKRRTFNVAPAEQYEKLHEHFEAMDVDDTLLPPTSTIGATSPVSPPIPAVLKRQMEEGISRRQQVALQQPQSEDKSKQMLLPSQSPPVPTLHKRNPAREMVQMSSEFPSPPIAALLQKDQPEETIQESHLSHSQSEEESKQMSPPSQSPPIPTLQKLQSVEEPIYKPQPSQSPPIPTLQKRNSEKKMIHMSSEYPSPPLPILQKHQFEEKEIESTQMPPPAPKSYIQKRPSIHTASAASAPDRFLKPAAIEKLSAKEQTKSNAKDEKDIFIDKTPSSLDEMFMATGAGTITKTSTAISGSNAFSGFGIAHVDGDSNSFEEEFSDADFQRGSNLILNPSDFDYLLTKGNNNEPVDRSSILLKFDPLLGVPIAPNQPQRQQQILQQILVNNNAACLSPTFEEDEQHNESGARTNKSSSSIYSAASESANSNGERQRSLVASAVGTLQEKQLKQQAAKSKKNARMSVDLIDNDCNKTFENSNSQSDEKQINYKMDDLEKKIKNEVLKTEDIEKKLKEAEQREEALIKRITEKDKTISKMNGVIEAYEKAIAELIAEKEQLILNYEKQLAEVKADRDSNYHHLTSLETTFSDLHVKYEKSKEMTLQLKSNEESLLAEKRQNLEYLRLQEQRYDKMKNHAMQQLEIANKKLESLTKEHAIESTKLKALLKKEEISRASINEQLQQKYRENAELMTICDELINGQGS